MDQLPGLPAGRRAALLLEAPTWKASVHGDKDCEECHSGFDEFPHGAGRETVSCADCHDDAAEALGRSVHVIEGLNTESGS